MPVQTEYKLRTKAKGEGVPQLKGVNRLKKSEEKKRG